MTLLEEYCECDENWTGNNCTIKQTTEQTVNTTVQTVNTTVPRVNTTIQTVDTTVQTLVFIF